MALFGNLFEKKTCAFCGNSIGLLGNRKLVDGNMCKDCAAKLSPYFSDRKESTVEEIGAQLDYRRANKEALKDFTVTRKLGKHGKIYIDDNHGKFFVTSSDNYMVQNPDIIDFAQVTSCDIEIPESKQEVRYYDINNKLTSFKPAQYDYSYNFYMDIYVSHPYIQNIRFRVNTSPVEIRNEVAHFEKERLDEIAKREAKVRKATQEGIPVQTVRPQDVAPQRQQVQRPYPQQSNINRNPQRLNMNANSYNQQNFHIDDTKPRVMRPFEFDVETYADYVEYANLACAIKYVVDNMMSEEGILSTEYYVECPNCGKTTAITEGVCQFCGLEIVL